MEGFVKNLCELYKINSDEILEDFRKELQENKKLEKEEYIQKKERLNFKFFNIWSISFLAITVIFFILIIVLSNRNSKKKENVLITSEDKLNVIEYTMIKEKEAFDLKLNDSVKIFLGGSYYFLEVINISSNAIGFNYNSEFFSIFEGNTIKIELNNDENKDLEIKLKKISGELAICIFTQINFSQKTTDYSSIWKNENHIQILNEYTIFKNQEKSPIELYIKAINLPSYLNYHIDGLQQDAIKLETGNDTIINANEHVEIIIGNYKSVMFIINKIPINLASDHDSYSVTKIIKWIPNPLNETKFNLVILDAIDL